MEPFQQSFVSDWNPWLSSCSSHHHHQMTTISWQPFADCDAAAAKAENGLCFCALDCFPGTPTALVEVGALPLPCDTPLSGAVPAGGTAPPSPLPTPFHCSFATFSASSNSHFLNLGVCLIFILKSEMH